MLTLDQVQQLSELLPNVKTLIIGLSASATYDQVAAATALYLSWVDQQKEVQLVMPTMPGEQFSQLSGVEAIKDELGNKDLQVSFAYTQEKVDKVSYHIDEEQERFYLIIKPKSGQKPLDTKTVQMEYVGAEADLIVLVGVHDLDQLEHLYTEYTQLYQDTTVVSLNTFESSVGQIKLDASGLSSVSEAVAQLVQSLDLPLSAETATNLLAGIEASTDNLRSVAATADTFETVARLLRSGARRLKRAEPVVKPTSSSGIFSANSSKTTGQVDAPKTTVSFGQALAESKKAKNGKRKATVVSSASQSEPEAVEGEVVSGGSDADLTPEPPAKKAGSLKYQPTGFGPGGNG